MPGGQFSREARRSPYTPAVMKILVDGYNLIAALWGMGGDRAELERQREQLVETISRYKKARGHQMEVVFDGWKDGDPMGSRTRDRGVEVVFSPKGVTADEVIRDTVQESEREILVVSSDKKVQGWTDTYGGKAINCRTFIARLIETDAEQGTTADEARDDYGDVWEGGTKKRGNPNKKSKRERAVDKKIRKL